MTLERDRVASPLAMTRPCRRSRQPALAPLVVLAFAERFALALGNAEVEFLDVLVLTESRRGSVEHDAAGFEDVAVTRVFERQVDILLGEQEGDAFAFIEALHDRENLFHD